MRRLGMAVSNDTVLRHLKRGVQITYDKKLRVVGIDDWAWKNGLWLRFRFGGDSQMLLTDP
jgi:hypothetical protein